MSDVVDFTGQTTLAVSCEGVLSNALKADLDRVIVVGFHEDGEMWFAASSPDGGGILWDMEMAKAALLEAGSE